MSNVTPTVAERNQAKVNETALKKFEVFASKVDNDFKKQSPNKAFDMLESSLKKEDFKVSDVKVTKRPSKHSQNSKMSLVENADNFACHYLSSKNGCKIDHHHQGKY